MAVSYSILAWNLGTNLTNGVLQRGRCLRVARGFERSSARGVATKGDTTYRSLLSIAPSLGTQVQQESIDQLQVSQA